MFTLKPTSGTPIYRQLVDQVHQLTASGRLEAGDRLPSVRAIAAELGVNPMTITKAYSLLEKEGVLRLQDAAPVVANTNVAPIDVLRPQALVLIDTAIRFGFSRKGTLDAIDQLWTQQETP